MMGAAIRPYLIGGAFLAFVGYSTAIFLTGHTLGAVSAEKRAVQQTFQQLKERGLINEAIRDLDDCRLLAELNGLSDNCTD